MVAAWFPRRVKAFVACGIRRSVKRGEGEGVADASAGTACFDRKTSGMRHTGESKYQAWLRCEGNVGIRHPWRMESILRPAMESKHTNGGFGPSSGDVSILQVKCLAELVRFSWVLNLCLILWNSIFCYILAPCRDRFIHFAI